jgi:ABC-type multidrug transport system ATPase subunit
MLTVQRLSHVYAVGTRAISGVDLTVGLGLFGLLGPNGAGKSTLMRILATIQQPCGSAEVRFGDIDVVREAARLRRVLGYLPQDFGTYPGISVQRMLDHFAVLKGIADRHERRDTVEALLRQVTLYDARDRELASLSGGMRRRFGLAQALIGRPRLIIVDEPTAGLDPEERFRCLDLFAEIAEEATVILSTHLVADVEALCTHMAILAGGRVVMTGAPADLVASLAGRVWRKEVDGAEAAALAAGGNLLSSRLVSGPIVANIFSATPPGIDYAAVRPTLGDGYFAALAGLER